MAISVAAPGGQIDWAYKIVRLFQKSVMGSEAELGLVMAMLTLALVVAAPRRVDDAHGKTICPLHRREVSRSWWRMTRLRADSAGALATRRRARSVPSFACLLAT
jgi:hypothetical protein